MNYLAVTLILAHFVGDWLLQTRETAQNKSKDLKVLFRHVLIVTSVLAIPVLIFVTHLWYLLIVYAILHAFQDWYGWRYYGRNKPKGFEYWEDKWFWNTIAIDQCIHISLLMAFFV